MQAIEKTKEFINYLDLDPKYPILEEPLEENVLSVYFEEKCYRINSDFNFNEIFKRNIEILELSVKSVRLRVQREMRVEIFPYVDVKKTGFTKKLIVRGLENDKYSFEDIDTEIVSIIACNLWQTHKKFLPLIKNIITLDASDIVKITEPFLKAQ